MIKRINIAALHTVEHHMSNANEDSSNKFLLKDNKEYAYISGQKIRYCLLENIKFLNKMESKDTIVTNSDGVTPFIEWDLRSDLGGYMLTSNKNYSKRRTSPLSVSMGISLKEYNSFDDLWVRFLKNDKVKDSENNSQEKLHNNQRINTKTYSVSDIFNICYSLDLDRVSGEKVFEYLDNFNVNEENIQHVSNDEKLRRIKLFIKGTKNLTGLGNQSRAMVNNRPSSLLITFDDTNDQSHIEFFKLNKNDRKKYLDNLTKRNVKYFLAETINDIDSCYDDAIKHLSVVDIPYSDNIQSVAQMMIEQARTTEELEFVLKYNHKYLDKYDIDTIYAKIENITTNKEKKQKNKKEIEKQIN